jgi:hypothetical protein
MNWLSPHEVAPQRLSAAVMNGRATGGFLAKPSRNWLELCSGLASEWPRAKQGGTAALVTVDSAVTCRNCFVSAGLLLSATLNVSCRSARNPSPRRTRRGPTVTPVGARSHHGTSEPGNRGKGAGGAAGPPPAAGCQCRSVLGGRLGASDSESVGLGGRSPRARNFEFRTRRPGRGDSDPRDARVRRPGPRAWRRIRPAHWQRGAGKPDPGCLRPSVSGGSH